MINLYIILVVIILAIIIFKQKNKLKWIFIILLLFLLLPFGILIADIYNRNFKDDGYGDDLEPIHSEINNIKKYETAIELIVENWERMEVKDANYEELTIEQILISKPKLYGKQLVDSILKIQTDTLKLRFTSAPYYNKISKKDTVIVFKANHTDYNMVSNDANKLYEIPPYSIYKHSIIYSTITIDTSNIYITHIKNNFYYKIDEYDEY